MGLGFEIFESARKVHLQVLKSPSQLSNSCKTHKWLWLTVKLKHIQLVAGYEIMMLSDEFWFRARFPKVWFIEKHVLGHGGCGSGLKLETVMTVARERINEERGDRLRRSF